MKVYVAERGYDYEGFTIIGIFDTKDKAWAENAKDHAAGRGDFHDIEEWDVE